MIVVDDFEYKPDSFCHRIAERKASGRLVRPVYLSQISAGTSITLLRKRGEEWQAAFYKKEDLHVVLSMCAHAIDEPNASWEWGYEDHRDHVGERFSIKQTPTGLRFSWGYRGRWGSKPESCTINVPRSHIPQLRASIAYMREHDRYPAYSIDAEAKAHRAPQEADVLAAQLRRPRALAA